MTMTEEKKKLYPQTDAEWREYCQRAKEILRANSDARKEKADKDA